MIDLHVHSVYSDGSDTPAELVAEAVRLGLSALALTDHDTVAGVAPFLAAAEGAPLEAVPGIELSAECERGTMHILGYFIDPESPDLRDKVGRIRQGRDARNQEILKRLNKLGHVLTWSEIERQAGLDVVGRPHFAGALVARGHVASRKAAFDLLLAKGRPAYAERQRLSAGECVGLVRRAGGVPVLAHPATIFLPEDELKALVGRLAGQGLAGIEAYYAGHHPDNIGRFAGWAREFGLVSTGGTDYHGAYSPDLKMGSGFGQLHVPDEALAQLKAARPA